MNTATAIPVRNPSACAYWKSVKLCVAKPDGSAVIHHLDGRVVRISEADFQAYLRSARKGR